MAMKILDDCISCGACLPECPTSSITEGAPYVIDASTCVECVGHFDAPKCKEVCPVADTAITEMPEANEIAEIAIEAAGVARRFGYEPRLALLAFSTFGHPPLRPPFSTRPGTSG